MRLDQGGEELTVPRDSIYQVLTAHGVIQKVDIAHNLIYVANFKHIMQDP